MSVCRSCGAPVVWAKTTARHPIPLNPEPSEAGNLAYCDAGVVEYVGGPRSLFDSDERPRYVSHFATCPDAPDWRKP
jgi:hypothetical protein